MFSISVAGYKARGVRLLDLQAWPKRMVGSLKGDDEAKEILAEFKRINAAEEGAQQQAVKDTMMDYKPLAKLMKRVQGDKVEQVCDGKQEQLAEAVATAGENNWQSVAELVGGRSGQQCRFTNT